MAIVFVAVIISVALWSSHHTYVVQNQSISHIVLRTKSQHVIQRTRFLLWEANNALQAYMISPDAPLDKKIRNMVSRASMQASKLKNIVNSGKEKLLKEKIDKLGVDLETLIKIRRDPVRLYPAMATMNDVMLPASNSFQTAATLALDEIEVDSLADNYKLYKIIDRLSDNWIRMIGAFRVFIANRFGAFSSTEKGLVLQAGNVDILFEQIKEDLVILQKLSEKMSFYIQANDSVQTMLRSADTWHTAYIYVRTSYLSNEWRTDIPYLQNRIQPQFVNIWDILAKIDLAIESTSLKDMEMMGSIAGKISTVLWLFSIMAFLIIISGYYILQRTILGPVYNLSKALFNEAQGHKHDNIKPESHVREMKELEQAFILMQEKIKERQTELQNKALHDPLTGLPNRALMEDRLQNALHVGERNSSSVVLLLIDLDGFKKINDTKGHLAGDGILKEVSGRLLDVTRNTGTVSRIGGDEFIVILPEAQENEVEEILKRIINIFTQPCLIDGEFLSIHLSIGAAIYPQHGVEPKTLIHNADSAMYRAKQTGKEYLIYRG